MTPHELTLLGQAHQIIVGWDRPLHTFFTQVLDTATDKDSDNRTILWIGGEFGAVSDSTGVVETDVSCFGL